MNSVQEAFNAWYDSDLVLAVRNLFEAAFFRPSEPQPASLWRQILNPPMPYWVGVFSQTCRIISLLLILPILAMGALDFAGYAVFRTLGLHRQRVRVMRQTGVKASAVRSNSSRRKPRIYQSDRNRPTDRSNFPSIVKAPLLTPGTYDAETLLRQRARSLSIASADEQEAYLASSGQHARLSSLSRDDPGWTSPDSLLSEPSSPRDYFGRAPRVGVEGALGLPDTDLDESGTESGRNSPEQRFSGGNRRRGLNFTPKDSMHTAGAGEGSTDSATSLTSDTKDPLTHDESSGSNTTSSSWVGVEPNQSVLTPSAILPVDNNEAAAAAGLESESSIFSTTSTET